ncbi:sodium neurotransmitter symporter (SNF) [Mactra antiquata]
MFLLLLQVAYVTVTFPTVLLLILLVQGTRLEGHVEGITFFLDADWSKLSDMSIWSSAATQAMYSLGIVFGSHLAMASYNNFRHNLTRDVIIVTLANTVTSILSGFVVFLFLGHASYRLNKPIDKLLENPGPSLLFVSYIQGISKLQGSAVWACLFFLMVLTLALDSAFIMAWTIHQAIIDVIPKVKKRWTVISLTTMCSLSFLLGVPLVTEGGIHMIVLLDQYTSNFSLTLFLLLESLSVCYIYGLANFLKDMEMMLGQRSKIVAWYFRITWSVTSPAFCVFIFIASAIGYSKSSYGGVEISTGGEVIGWLVILTPFVMMISYMVFLLYKHRKPEKNISSLLQTVSMPCEVNYFIKACFN